MQAGPTLFQLVELAVISGGFALGGVVLGALVAGLYGLRAKPNEYVNDYYKSVIQRRIAAYERLEALVMDYKMCVVGGDKRPYHVVFLGDNPKESAFKRLIPTFAEGLWLSDAAFSKTSELNYLLFDMPESEGDAVEFAKKHYREIAELRDTLERILAADMLDLHDVQRFLSRMVSAPG